MHQDLLKWVTGLGDPALLLLGGFAVFFYLWTDDDRRVLARGWAVAFCLCVFLTVASKFAFHFFGEGQRSSFYVQSPSGHVAIATGFYGCCALLLAAGRRRAARVLVCVGTAMLVGMLAVSRIMLGLHTVPEIATGFAIGALCLAVFRISMRGAQRIAISTSQLSALLLLIGVTHYSHVDGEPLIKRLAQKLDFLRGEQADGLTEQGSELTARIQLNGLVHGEKRFSREAPSGTSVDSAKR
jgi:membrane-associated phospholipid phosphatase